MLLYSKVLQSLFALLLTTFIGLYSTEKSIAQYQILAIQCGHWFEILKHIPSNSSVVLPLKTINLNIADYSLRIEKENNTWIFQIIDSRNTLIGEAWYTLRKNKSCFFNVLWVNPNYRKLKLGTFLINLSLAHLASIGCKKITGRAENVKNTPNISTKTKIDWYKRLGAHQTPHWLEPTRITYRLKPSTISYEQLYSKL